MQLRVDVELADFVQFKLFFLVDVSDLFLFCSGRGKGEFEAPGGGAGDRFFYSKIPGGGGGSRRGGAEGLRGCLQRIGGFWGGKAKIW